MTEISICVCTRNRPEGLRNLLKSIENMQVPPIANIRIIVVENDSKNFSESIVKEFSAVNKFRANYYLETRQGISFARNKSVEEAIGSDFCCFVDDDQIVASDWLVELVKCQREFDSDGVQGVNPPVFNKKVPSYLWQFHSPQMYAYGTILKTAWTNCLLIKKEYLDKINGPFDLRLNFTGGEDHFLTYLISSVGGEIRFNPDAIAYEIIRDNRATIKYVIKRTFRISNSGLFVKSLEDIKFSKLNVLLRLSIRFCYGLLIVIPFLIFGKADKLKGLIKIVNAIGGFAFIFGKLNQFYK